MINRSPGRRAQLLVLTGVAAALPACSGPAADDAAAASSSASAALSSAAQASPGAYGEPADPSMPNPTDVATDPTGTAGPSAGPSATVVVTYAGWVEGTASVEVGAYVAGVVETGGTCSLQLTGPGGGSSATVTAEPDAGSTSCPDMVVPGEDLAAGTYTAVVTYSSAATSGTSVSSTVDVP